MIHTLLPSPGNDAVFTCRNNNNQTEPVANEPWPLLTASHGVAKPSGAVAGDFRGEFRPAPARRPSPSSAEQPKFWRSCIQTPVIPLYSSLLPCHGMEKVVPAAVL